MQHNAYSLSLSLSLCLCLSNCSVSCLRTPMWTKWREHKVKHPLQSFNLCPCTCFALWLPQCHIKHLKFRCINIMLQAIEQDGEDIKRGTNDNTQRLLVDKSVSPYTQRERGHGLRSVFSVLTLFISFILPWTSQGLGLTKKQRMGRVL